jgi:hypothetical protein
MTRTEACIWQEKLFPRGLWRKYQDVETPDPGNIFRSIPPTLCEIAIDVRASCSGASDPWKTELLQEVRDMLQARLDTWHNASMADFDFDHAVMVMVEEAIRIANEELKSREKKQ